MTLVTDEQRKAQIAAAYQQAAASQTAAKVVAEEKAAYEAGKTAQAEAITKAITAPKTYEPTQEQIEQQFTANTEFAVTYKDAGVEKTETFKNLGDAQKFANIQAQKNAEFVVNYMEGNVNRKATFKTADQASKFIEQLTGTSEFVKQQALASQVSKLNEYRPGIKGHGLVDVIDSARSTAQDLERKAIASGNPVGFVGGYGLAMAIEAGAAGLSLLDPRSYVGAVNLITSLTVREKGETSEEYRQRIDDFMAGDVSDTIQRDEFKKQLLVTMPVTDVSPEYRKEAKELRETFADYVVQHPALFVADIAGGVITGKLLGLAVKNISGVKQSISLEQRMWEHIHPIDEVPLEAGDIAPFKGGVYDSPDVPLIDDYGGPVLIKRGSWSNVNAWKADPLEMGGTPVVMIREAGTNNVIKYMTWEKVVSSTGGNPELLGLLGIITLADGTKVYAEPAIITIPLNNVSSVVLQETITKIEPKILQKAITRLDEKTLQKIDEKTLIELIPKLNFDTIQTITPKLDDVTLQKIVQSPKLSINQKQDVIQSLNQVQTVELVQKLTPIQIQMITPLLNTAQITILTNKLSPLKRSKMIETLEKKGIKKSVEEDKFTVTFTDYGGRVEVLNVRASTFREAYWRAFAIKRWHGRPHIVDLVRNL